MPLSTIPHNGSATFHPPPLDGSLTYVETFDYNGRNNAAHTLFRYKQLEGNGFVHDIKWGQAMLAIHAAARVTQANCMPFSGRPVVAILAVSDSITYFTLIAGIMRAGYLPFPISPRNSHLAVANLIKATGSSFLYVSPDHAMQALSSAACGILAADASPKLLKMPTFDDLFNSDSPPVLIPALENINQDTPAVILHSSGSTAFPKPITLTMRIMMEDGIAPYYGDLDLSVETISAHAIPMFHLMGVVLMGFTAYTGLAMAVFPPVLPPMIPTPERVFTGAVETASTIIFCAPLFLEMWARDSECCAAMKKFTTIIYAGGPLDSRVGDMLVAQGIKIDTLYGQTESGPLTVFLPKSYPPEGWDYWRFSSHCEPVFLPYEGLDRVYKLLVKECPSHTPAIFNTEVDGVQALDTNDLIIRHPSNPDLWKVYGRSDDQIMHSTGEKTNPVPLEAILASDAKITSAIMFGRTRFNAGVIVTPSPDQVFDPADTSRLAQYRNAIWDTVTKANQFAPAHSRIFKEMILVAHPSKPFEHTPKGTPRRQAVLNAYAKEIDDAYSAVKQSSQVHLPAPNEWNALECIDFARRVISEVMVVKVNDDDDIFQNGCDSLQMTWIRNTIMHALQSSSKVDARAIPQNFVYSNPTIRRLGGYLCQLAGNSDGPRPNGSQASHEMLRLSHEYSTDFQLHRTSGSVPSQELVLLTGTTGGFGAEILAKLLGSTEISKVYAFNRKGPGDLLTRQQTKFDKNGLDISLLDSPKLVLCEGDLTSEYFGLGEKLHGELRDQVTCIIHNAWRVDFNISLASMTPLIAGTRRLIDFALSSPHKSPPRFVFVSSAGVFRNWPSGNTAPEARISDPAIAAGSGYSESKWVAETVLSEAARVTALDPVIVRVGQLSGGMNGAWNINEWFPALVRSSQVLECIPRVDGHISWIPIDAAASAIVEMRKSKHQYLNLVHPNPAPVFSILRALSAALSVPLVSYAEWLTALEAQTNAEDGKAGAIPALKLLEFFRSLQGAAATDEKHEAFGFPSLEGRLASDSTPSLRQLSETQLSEKDAENWVSYWRKIQYLM